MIDLGTEGKHLMEIVAIDTDDRADGQGKAGLTWISKTLLNTNLRMNNTSKDYIGGWESSDLRGYLQNTIKPLIPTAVRDAIVSVTKIQCAMIDGKRTVNGQTTQDDVWIPSDYEVGAGTAYENIGAIYNNRFTSNTDRIKKRFGQGSAEKWWLRSGGATSNPVRCIDTTGSTNGQFANEFMGIALGFCTN